MDLWKIRNRSFLKGESKVLWKIDLVDQLYYAEVFHKSSNPIEMLTDYHNELRDLVKIEKPVSREQMMERIRKLNEQAIKNIPRG